MTYENSSSISLRNSFCVYNMSASLSSELWWWGEVRCCVLQLSGPGTGGRWGHFSCQSEPQQQTTTNTTATTAHRGPWGYRSTGTGGVWLLPLSRHVSMFDNDEHVWPAVPGQAAGVGVDVGGGDGGAAPLQPPPAVEAAPPPAQPSAPLQLRGQRAPVQNYRQ